MPNSLILIALLQGSPKLNKCEIIPAFNDMGFVSTPTQSQLNENQDCQKISFTGRPNVNLYNEKKGCFNFGKGSVRLCKIKGTWYVKKV
jgi:hypothetical protein